MLGRGGEFGDVINHETIDAWYSRSGMRQRQTSNRKNVGDDTPGEL